MYQPNKLWIRYVNDMYTKLEKEYAQQFTDHMSMVDDNKWEMY